MSWVRAGPGVEVAGVLDGYIVVDDPTRFFPWLGPKRRNELEEITDHRGAYRFLVGAYLIRHHGRITLVDAGIGPRTASMLDDTAFMRGGALLTSIEAMGVYPDEISEVVVTHLHADHMGWIFHHGERTFPRATIVVHQADYDFFAAGDGRSFLDRELAASPGFRDEPGKRLQLLEGVRDKLALIDGDIGMGRAVSVLHVPGHTPGNLAVVVSGDDQRIYLTGDVLQCPHDHLGDPAWAGFGDTNRELAESNRNALLGEIAQAGGLMAGAHFPELAFVAIERPPGCTGFRWHREH